VGHCEHVGLAVKVHTIDDLQHVLELLARLADHDVALGETRESCHGRGRR